MTALAVIIVNLAVILLAMLFFVVCVRICIHSGYYYKASAHPNHLISVEDSLKLTLQTQVTLPWPLLFAALHTWTQKVHVSKFIVILLASRQSRISPLVACRWSTQLVRG